MFVGKVEEENQRKIRVPSPRGGARYRGRTTGKVWLTPWTHYCVERSYVMANSRRHAKTPSTSTPTANIVILQEIVARAAVEPESDWIGYVAVASNPDVVKKLRWRDIVFAWRGTVTYLEWVEDLKINQVKPKFGPDDKVRVESGFLDLYNSKEPA
ncbi:hypothetical protein AMTR_s00038p00114760 [Amborella trichopoda]|uniref:Fungal lipase-type domain-containing protein n=1 Tax=Amborella trichopoda TaxID=13333 RepID=U5CZL2_AMBTC|nr:hypothetical protein AMTR_s00038p00114760 [Amborella trichopoda]